MQNDIQNKLDELRKDAFILQKKYLDLLCPEDEKRLDLAFARFLWEIDEERRKIYANLCDT